MIAPADLPHYLLLADATDGRDTFDDAPCGRWCFMLELLGTDEVVDAWDYEAGLGTERLELLAVVRGLEALDQPSRVMLVTPSRYVNRGIRFGMKVWRESDWQWEAFGLMSPIKNHDLWRRLDQAMQIHQVECRRWRLGKTSDVSEEASQSQSEMGDCSVVKAVPDMAAAAG